MGGADSIVATRVKIATPKASDSSRKPTKLKRTKKTFETKKPTKKALQKFKNGIDNAIKKTIKKTTTSPRCHINVLDFSTKIVNTTKTCSTTTTYSFQVPLRDGGKIQEIFRLFVPN